MSGSHSPHSSLSTPTPTSLSVSSRNMHSLPTTSTAVYNTHAGSDGQHYGPGKYTSTSTLPSFASVVSSAAGSSSAIPVYDSTLASPASLSFAADQRSNCSAGADQSGSDSSDVEIYLNTLVLHESVPFMHDPNANDSQNELSISSSGSHLSAGDDQQHSIVVSDSASPGPTFQTAGANPKFGLGVSDGKNSNDTKSTNINPASTLSPLPLSLPLSSSPSQLQSRNGNGQQDAKSPKIPPPAPVHTTIPLPEVDRNQHNLDERAPYIERRQFQHQYQPLRGHGHQERGYGLVQGDTIDFAGLNISSAPQQQTLGMPSPFPPDQSLSSPSEFGITPSSTISSGFDVSSSTSTAATTPALGSAVSGLCVSESSANSVDDAGGVLSLPDSNKTPNVYINGLPPHFPEDQLFALASPFGEIRSVRTFTRHVRDSESGYGFVLFETIEGAERCIVSLRRYRNLHPTFSKQIHKIPGTTYAPAHMATSGSSTPWDETGEVSGASIGGPSTAGDATFKAKMESLHDPTSTNLYMEGLPLSIDEPTLAALVSPHRISSSRFFQTRLSHPPRIIAFVRLETRTGAEEVIERLHGRMVRGWNDTGSRISVRFADTSEQRELRRTERSTDEGDGSPARMTIAQAALLNLRGQELRPSKAAPVIHAQPGGVRAGRIAARGFGNSVSVPDFSSNAHFDNSSGGGGGSKSNGLEVDYSLAPGRNLSIGGGIGHGRGPSPGVYPYQTQQSSNWAPHPLNQGHGHGQSPMDPTMITLLDSLRGNGVSSDYMQNRRSVGVGHHLHPAAHSLQHHNHLGASRSLGDISYSRPGPAYTRSGYTATEEYIMRAHADSAALAQAQAQAQYQQHQQTERRRPAPLDLRRHQRGDEGQDESGAPNIAVGLPDYRTQASIGRVGQEITSPPIISSSSSQSMMGGLSSTMSEEDFHASAAAVRSEFRQQLRSLTGNCGDRDGESRMNPSPLPSRHNPHIQAVHVNAPLSREPSGQYQLQPQQQSSHQQPPQQVQRPLALSPLLPPSSSDSPNPNDLVNYQHAATHMRSTTLPQHRSSSVRDSQQQQMHRVRGHYQHSSMSIPAQTLRTPQHASVSVMNGNSGVDASGGVIYEGEHQQQQPCSQGANQQNGSHGSMDAGNVWTNNNSHSQPSLHSHGTKSHFSSPNIYSDDPSSSSPSLISPTLTYSSQTPSTLSPATPFFGSFNNQAEGFEKGTGAGHGVNVHGLDQQQKNRVSATRSGSQ